MLAERIISSEKVHIEAEKEVANALKNECGENFGTQIE